MRYRAKLNIRALLYEKLYRNGAIRCPAVNSVGCKAWVRALLIAAVLLAQCLLSTDAGMYNILFLHLIICSIAYKLHAKYSKL